MAGLSPADCNSILMDETASISKFHEMTTQTNGSDHFWLPNVVLSGPIWASKICHQATSDCKVVRGLVLARSTFHMAWMSVGDSKHLCVQLYV